MKGCYRYKIEALKQNERKCLIIRGHVFLVCKWMNTVTYVIKLAIQVALGDSSVECEDMQQSAESCLLGMLRHGAGQASRTDGRQLILCRSFSVLIPIPVSNAACLCVRVYTI